MPRILVIEDDRTARKVLGAALMRDGHEVTLLAELAEVLPAAVACRPDLVISDWLFPEHDAMETIESLRRLFPALPLIFMSGAPLNTFEDRVRALNPVGLLEKPFSLQEVRDMVRQALP